MKAIMAELYRKNPNIRIVINAITMETICDLKEVIKTYQDRIKDLDIVQLQASKAKKVGDYHLMQAQNPVWICSFTFAEAE